MLISSQGFLQELFGNWADIEFENKVIYFLILDLSYQLFLVFGFPWCFSHQHLKKDDSKCPNVSFESILISSQWLWCHIKGRSDIVLIRFECFWCFYGETEISDFELLRWSDENICRLEISVNDIFSCEIEIAYQHLLHKLDCLVLWESFFDSFIEIWVTKLGDDVCVVLGGVDLVKWKDMWQWF